jgi:fermentation-respiration switch protein FrsA (DUF1100 family)
LKTKEKKKMKWPFVVGIILVLLILIFFVFSFLLAKYIMADGRRQTLEEAKKWQSEHCDISYFKEENCVNYTVKGYEDYELHVTYYPNSEETDKYIILSHGYTDNRMGNLKYLEMYLDLGFNCIIYDLRGHGENAKAITTYGNYEAKDLIKIIEDTRNRYQGIKELGLHGESLGSATTITALQYKPEVDFAVTDCPFADIENVLRGGARSAKLPEFFIDIMNIGSKIRYGLSLDDMRPINAIVDNKVPILLIHGAADSFIVPDNSKRLYEADPGYKEFYTIEGASHAMSIFEDRELYIQYVTGFLNTVESGMADN